MNFSKYYDSEQFHADKMYTRATVAITNKDYQPPPDIQLFYLLEIINDFAVLGQTYIQLDLRYIQIDDSVFTKLYELGYMIETYDEKIIIRWNWRT